jgi:hypothetical protein
LANAFTGVPFVSDLTDQDVSGHDSFATKLLYATSLGG